jgi:hypothetical protein
MAKNPGRTRRVHFHDGYRAAAFGNNVVITGPNDKRISSTPFPGVENVPPHVVKGYLKDVATIHQSIGDEQFQQIEQNHAADKEFSQQFDIDNPKD